jgi:hypothetical protein
MSFSRLGRIAAAILCACLMATMAMAGQPPLTGATQLYINGLIGNTVAGLDTNHHLLVSAAGRPPTQDDGILRGYAVGSVWYYNNLIWTLTDSTAAHAIWVKQGPALYCDLVQCLGAWGHMKVRYGYSGAAAHLVRIDALGGAGLDIPFVGNFIDANTANGYCAGAVNAAIVGAEGCLETITYDQISYGAVQKNETNANLWAIAASLTAGGTGYTSGNNQHLTLSNGSGTCSTPTIINANVSGGVVNATNWSIFQQGICTVLPAQPQAISGGTGGTVTVNYYSAAPVWLPQNTINSLMVARAFPSFQFNTGAGTSAMYPVSVYTSLPSSFTWTPNNATWAFAGENVSAGVAGSAVMTTDLNYGITFGQSNSQNISLLGANTAGTVGNNDNCGVFKEAAPAVTLATWNGTSFTCRENNQFGTLSTGTYAGSAYTGGSEGYPGTPTFTGLKPNNRIDDNAVTIASVALTSAQQIAGAASLAWELQIPAQIRDVLLLTGGSFTMGATSQSGNSPSQFVTGQYVRPLKVFNMAQYGQSLSSEISGFGGGYSEQRLYTKVGATANSFIESYQGLDNDITNLESNGLGTTANLATLHGEIMNYRYLWKSAPTTGQTPIAVVWGVPPVSCVQQNDPLALALMNVLIPDEETNWNGPAPSNCSTLTSCTSGGMGMDAFVDYFREPSIGGVNALTGGAFPVGTSPNVPFCSGIWSNGKHPGDAAQQVMGVRLKQVIDTITPQ